MKAGISAIVALGIIGIIWWITSDRDEPVASTVTSAAAKADNPTSAGVASVTALAPTPDAPAPLPLDRMADESRRILTQANLNDRYDDFRKLLANTFDKAALQRLVETMEKLGEEGFPLREEWGYLWYYLARRDPVAAMTLADHFGKEHKWYGDALNAVASRRAQDDPEAAMQWLDSREDIDGKLLDNAILSLVRGLSEVDIEKATAFVMQNFNPKTSGSAHYAVTASILRQRGVPGLNKWFESLPDDAARNRWFPSVSNRLYEAGREVQKTWMLEQAAKPWRNDRAYVDMFMGWAATDPQTAMDFAMQLPPNATGNYTGIGTCAYEWLVKDSPGFQTFYAGLAEGPIKAGILKALQLGVADPDMPNRKNAPARAFLQSIGQMPEAKP